MMSLAGQRMSMPGYFRLDVDEAAQTLRVTLEGSWTPGVAQAFVAAHNAATDRCRQDFGRLKLISDATRMPIQSQEVTAIITAGQKVDGDDRFAVVLETTLAKIASRRHLQERYPGGQWEVFISAKAAETWLQAES